MASNVLEQKAVIHIVVVGFHHKKGCQVEYSYPPLIEGEDNHSSNLPDEWKYLPFLALPDGAHNYDEDTIYFHLPPRPHYKQKTTVYGVSCYRQISTHLLKRKDDDVTRETVQKSVVALSQMPIYGILHAKLRMITQAYFEEKDFAKNDILKELFDHVNVSVSGVDNSQRLLGLSARSLVLNFQHKILMLFKLILLERRVVFYASPVNKLVGGIMALLSLFPEMIEKGLSECTTSMRQHTEMVRSMLPVNENKLVESNGNCDCSSEIAGSSAQNADLASCTSSSIHGEDSLSQISHSGMNGEKENCLDKNVDGISLQSVEKPAININQESEVSEDTGSISSKDAMLISTPSADHPQMKTSRNTSSSIWYATSETALSIAATVSSKLENLSSSFANTIIDSENKDNCFSESIEGIEDDDDDDHRFNKSFGNSRLELKADSPAQHDSTELVLTSLPRATGNVKSSLSDILSLDNYRTNLYTNEYGFPLSVFARGYLCLPYVSLQQFNDLSENFERGFVVGATNILFKTQPHLADVVVDMENATMDIRDANLRRLLHLTAADLRFAENLLSNVSDHQVDDIFLDATGWEGGDEWIQYRFVDYITSLLSLSTVTNANPKNVHDYNEHFIAAWKQTQNYRVWAAGDHKAISEFKSSHPSQAQYSVSDVKLRLHHSLQSSDRGRKIEGAMNSANQAVVSTGKYMGTALVSAKTTVSSWWSSRVKKDT